ncbi:BnaC01g14800D [Brassica napus]|uniref:BnaC01g14800D protein n=1 Tax=Brassica napus TaxID=3708 RepID=A0A078F8S6_BRANA|nr:BnaC01g14800D [Brassica napus]
MIGLIDQASSLYYAARTQKLESSISHVYGVVQCSRDLSLQNCTRCLQQNVIEYTSCCRGRQGGTISRPSCFIRWEVYPFLALLDNMPPLEKGKIMYHNLYGKGVSTGTIVAIVIVPIVLLALGFAIWRRRKSHKASITTANGYFSAAKRLKKTYDTEPLDNAGDDISTSTSGSLQFDFKAIEAATNNFHNINKLGHGGFGEVYKTCREHQASSLYYAARTQKLESSISHVYGISTGTIVAIVIVPIVLLALGFAIWRRRKSHKASITTANGYFSAAKRLKKTYDTEPLDNAEDDISTSGSLQFDLKAIEAATSNFHNINKLGHGGFGEVYKGTFPNGTEIAVKRLSKTSGQGEREFKNEVLLVAKLQHRNLVRLLGFCVQGEERILVYEFLPNKSLNYFLFGDSTKRSQLDWTRRYKIIGGITRGILYLHQDSRLTIIHRDLKASNILLDADMNPKIADFGMARNFRMDQTEDNTGRVVGTFGYMPPEYVANGQFSTKSDVYSFGVLILEIIGGKKNSSFHEIDGSTGNLVTYVWRLWNNDSLLELVDPVIGDNYDKYEVIRCVHIGLLCVQENPTDRPSMFTIFQMLTNTSITLPVPQHPGFFFRVRSENIPLAESFQPGPSTSMSIACSVNDATITCVSPR